MKENQKEKIYSRGQEYECDVSRKFSHILGLSSKTDGTLFIYKSNKKGVAKKPDGYYFYEGITFILDAKSPNKKFTGQIFDYMDLESSEHFIGFEYNEKEFRCYVNGKLQDDELEPKNKEYYKEKYFPKKINNEAIVSGSAKKLANLFRNSNIDKQMNVPFIGAVMLCFKYQEEIDLTSTSTILNSIKMGINTIFTDDMPLNKRQKQEFILKILGDSSLQKAQSKDLYAIVQEISTIYNFINISADDYRGYDIMNSFLKIFRKWNSANANEKGEVFTPDHIANLMYALAHCSKDNNILDPTCGSGTFLTNAMANMFNELEKDESFNEKQKIIKENKLYGIEISEFNATLAGINMLLHGDGATNIFNENCFTKLKSFQNLFDRALMNPPFNQRDCELKFVYETLKRMKDGGFLACVLPKPCVKGTIRENIDYLEKIFKISNLNAVVSLPSNLFYPVGANTCIIVLEKTREKNRETLLISCLDDGYVVENESRIDKEGRWEDIKQEILEAYLNNNFKENRAIRKENLKHDDELLFEAYSSHRAVDIEEKVFARYIRECVSSQILCGKTLKESKLDYKNMKAEAYRQVSLTSIIEKIEKGKEPSIKRTLEDKFDLKGIPLMIAKKDNNGIGGMKRDYAKSFKDKICIVSGGDGGGGKTYYCDYEFCATSFIMICDFKEEFRSKIDKYAKYYISIIISERLFKTIAHGRGISDIPTISIKLPIKKSGELDFDFMSNYIKKFDFAEFL